MEIVTKLSDTEYKVGIYIVEFLEGDWIIMQGDKTIARFYDKSLALSWANLSYTCGHLIGQGVRQLLLLQAKEQEYKNGS